MLCANVASTLIKSGENRVRGGISVGVKEILSGQPVNYLHKPPLLRLEDGLVYAAVVVIGVKFRESREKWQNLGKNS